MGAHRPLCCVVAGGRVAQYCEKGDLKSYLEKNETDELSKLKFALGAARGLEHVHSKGFVHRDVAARNILLDSLLRPKVSDFGLAREETGPNEAYYRGKAGNLPIRWYGMARKAVGGGGGWEHRMGDGCVPWGGG